MLAGRTTLAAGRILPASEGRCTGCDRHIDR